MFARYFGVQNKPSTGVSVCRFQLFLVVLLAGVLTEGDCKRIHYLAPGPTLVLPFPCQLIQDGGRQETHKRRRNFAAKL